MPGRAGASIQPVPKNFLPTAASSGEKDLRNSAGGNKDAAKKIGQLVGERAKAAGVSKVVFDRAGYRYHGRVKALADGARQGGLEF